MLSFLPKRAENSRVWSCFFRLQKMKTPTLIAHLKCCHGSCEAQCAYKRSKWRKEEEAVRRGSLSRPKKRKYYGKPRSAPRDDPVEHEDVEESLENSECGSSSASKLRTLPSLRTPCTPVDVYDQSSTSASAASSDSSSCSETECSEGDDDDDDDEVDSDSSTWSDDDGCDSELSGNRVVNMSCLSKLISEGCSCSRCGGRLVLHERSRWGIAPELTLTCSACERETSEVMSNKIGRYFEVNRRAVFAGRAVGLGREGLVKFCALMDMHHPCQTPATKLTRTPSLWLQVMWPSLVWPVQQQLWGSKQKLKEAQPEVMSP